MPSSLQKHATPPAYARVEVRPLPPELYAAAFALWSHYETLDVRYSGQLHVAEADLLAALPIIDGHEHGLRLLAQSLVMDVQQQPNLNTSSHYSLRFMNGSQNLSQLLPENVLSRVTIMPMTAPYSYHADADAITASDITAQIPALATQHFTFIAAACAETGTPALDDEFINQRQPLTPEQIASYQTIAHMIAQAMADAINLGMEAQAGLAGAMGAIRGAAMNLLANLGHAEKQLGATPLALPIKSDSSTPPLITKAQAVRRSAVQLEKAIKSQTGNIGLSAALHQTLRTGLQRLQQVKARSGIHPRVQVIALPRAEKQILFVPRQMTRNSTIRSALPQAKTPANRGGITVPPARDGSATKAAFHRQPIIKLPDRNRDPVRAFVPSPTVVQSKVAAPIAKAAALTVTAVAAISTTTFMPLQKVQAASPPIAVVAASSSASPMQYPPIRIVSAPVPTATPFTRHQAPAVSTIIPPPQIIQSRIPISAATSMPMAKGMITLPITAPRMRRVIQSVSTDFVAPPPHKTTPPPRDLGGWIAHPPIEPKPPIPVQGKGAKPHNITITPTGKGGDNPIRNTTGGRDKVNLPEDRNDRAHCSPQSKTREAAPIDTKPTASDEKPRPANPFVGLNDTVPKDRPTPQASTRPHPTVNTKEVLTAFAVGAKGLLCRVVCLCDRMKAAQKLLEGLHRGQAHGNRGFIPG